jgi:hypothetical protein
MKPKFLKDIAGNLPNYITLGAVAADAVVTVGRIQSVLSSNQASSRTALGLGSAALSSTTDFATSAQGTLAGSALQPGILPVGTTLSSTDATNLFTNARVNTAIGLNVSATRTALGLGTAALSASTAFATSAQGVLAGTALQPGTLPIGTTLNATEANNLVTNARVVSAIGLNVSATRTALGLGSAALSSTSDFATSAQGTLAGTALQPGTLPVGTTLNTTEANNLVTNARVVSAIGIDAAAARTALGLGTAALSAASAFATSAQGTLASTALQQATADARYPRTVLGVAPDAGGNIALSVLTEETSYASHTLKGFTNSYYVKNMLQEYKDIYEARVWQPAQKVDVGAVRLPTAYYLPGVVPATVKIHRCIQAGITGNSEPTWATEDFYINSGSSSTTDGTAVWRAYNIIHVDSAVADNSGDGSQGAPYRDWRATPFTSSATLANSAWSPGRAVALKRGSVFNSYQPTGFEGSLARMYIKKPTGATALYPERRTVMSYGQGFVPVIEGGGGGVLKFGILVADTSAASHEGFVTFQDIAVNGSGNVSTAGGAGIMVTVRYEERSPGYSTHPTGCAFIGCKVYDFYIAGGGTSATSSDCNGLQTFGAQTVILDCEVTDCGDDNYWLLGSNLVVIGNRSSGSATHSTYWPTRERGDEMQINSSPWNGNGDTPCNNVIVVGNSLVHNNPNKHVMIINPEVTGTDNRSKNYLVAYNYMESAVNSTINQISFYCSGIEGTINNNLVISRHTRATTDTAAVFLTSAVDFYNNLVLVYGNYRALELGPVSLNGGAVINTATGARAFNNTFVNLGTSTVGILNWGTGVATSIVNNTIIGFSTGVQAVAGTRAGYNAFQAVTTNYSGGATLLGNDVVSANLKTYLGIPYSKTSALRNAGYKQADSLFDDFGGSRRVGSKPTIGACEVPLL